MKIKIMNERCATTEPKLEVKNFTEEIVIRRLSELLAQRTDVCVCERCKADMLAYALNGLPARTYVSREGAIYRELDALGDGFKLEVIEKCLLAISHITEYPLHKLDKNHSESHRRNHETRETGLRSGKKEGLCCDSNDRRPRYAFTACGQGTDQRVDGR
jgi:competence protein ComFB